MINLTEQGAPQPWVVLLCDADDEGRILIVPRVFLVRDEATARAAEARIGERVREKGLRLLIEPAIPHESAESVARQFYAINRIWLDGD